MDDGTKKVKSVVGVWCWVFGGVLVFGVGGGGGGGGVGGGGGNYRKGASE